MTAANYTNLNRIRDILTERPRIPAPRLVIYGPARSGKSVLISLLSAEFQDVDFFDIPALMQPDNETTLFHAMNTSAENGRFMCMVCRPETVENMKLLDLSSRIAASLRIDIAQPDEHLLRMLLQHAFTIRQLSVSADVVAYCAARLPRSYDAPERCADMLDRYSLEKKRPVSLKLAAECPDAFTH